MVILGLDPGTATTGYGVISMIGNHIRPIAYGVVQTPSTLEMSKRLVMIFEAIEKIIRHEIDSLPVLRKENGKLTLVGRFTKTNAIKLYYQELKNKNI